MSARYSSLSLSIHFSSLVYREILARAEEKEIKYHFGPALVLKSGIFSRVDFNLDSISGLDNFISRTINYITSSAWQLIRAS